MLASSGGNAGLAAAYASKFYNVACLVCLPTITKPHIITKLHEYNAKTIKVGANINEADSFLKNEVMSQFSGMHIIYCHPFDNPYIWEGHSSLVDELSLQLSARDSSKLKSIVCSVGGGGLYNGIFQGLQKNLSNFNNYPNLLLIETNQAPTMAATLKAGKVFTLDSVNSVATSLACSYLSPKSLKNFQLKNESGIESILATIDDLESVKALVEFYNHTGIVVEPACGAALSVVYNQLHLLRESMDLKEDDIIVIVACGGSCTSREGLNEFKKLITRQNNKL